MRYIMIAFLILSLQLFSLTPNEAFKNLQVGNDRFLSGKSTFLNNDQQARRKALIDNQKPYAIILGCSDSRVAPEILFDQGLGELFIIRVAGNVLGESEIDSITYAVKALGCSLIVVLGHENCGAVDAVWQKKADMIPFIKKEIQPAIDEKDPKCTLACQIKNNITHVVDLLNKTPQFKTDIEKGSLQVVGAYYPFVSGQVEFLKN